MGWPKSRRPQTAEAARYFRCVGLASVLVTSSLLAQSNTGELRLKVTDPAGLGVKSSVEMVSQINQFRKTLLTDGAGNLVAKNVPFGIYRIRVQQEGFAAYSSSVEVRSAIPVEVSVKLSLASIRAAVEVHDTNTLIDPHRTGTINRIGADAIRDRVTSLPGRSVVDLVNSQPGWLYEGNGVLHPRGSEYQTQMVVDGVPLLDNRSPSFGPEIEADDVQSMSIYTADIPAEYGRKMGGVIEIVTAKDTRESLHGDAIASGGSFSTADGSVSTQYQWDKNTLGVTADGARTDRYLNPPVLQNYTNATTTSNLAVHYERDLTENDRFGLIVRHEQSGFEVPNEQLQEAAGQRQDRDVNETMAIFSYQHIFSPSVLGDLRVMIRDETNRLWSNPLSTPIVAGQDRGFREEYMKGSVSVHHGIQEWKAGVESDFTSLREQFNYAITDPTQFDPNTPATFNFFGRGRDWEQSAFVQDFIRLGNWTVSAGLRWDHYQLLVNQNAVSPRLGVARYWKSADLVLHASYDRVFQTPAFENILLASSSQIVALDPIVLRLPVLPSRGNYFEVGLTKGIMGKFKLDADYFVRNANNYADDDLLLNTAVSFPIAFRKAGIYGAEGKLDVPQWGRLSGFVAYSYIVGAAYLPVTGGLFLGDDATNALSRTVGRIWDSQDQRNTVRTRFRYQLVKRAWVALGVNYGSGLPVEFQGTEQDAVNQYGQQIVDRVNLAHGRVKPSLSVDASVGVDLLKSERLTMRLQGDVQNINNRLNVIDFAGLFSGNAVAPPRNYAVRLTSDF